MKRFTPVTALLLSMLTTTPLAHGGEDGEDAEEDGEEREEREEREDRDRDVDEKEEDADERAPKKKKTKRRRAPITSTDDRDRGANDTSRNGVHHVPPRVIFSGELVGATPLDRGNRDRFGIGGGAALGAEIHATPLLAVSAGVLLLGLTAGDGMSSTTYVAGQLGPRIHMGPSLFGALTRNAAWIDAHVTFGTSGGIRRSGFDVGAAVQWEVSPAVRIGPMLRYQFGSDPRDAHAQLFTVGLAIGIGGRGRSEIHIDGDADSDGVLDASDRCPTRAAGETPDPDREGCPTPDRDGDGILDRDDECPDDAVGERPDRERHGCPLVDTDDDAIPDTKDRCPEEPGPPNPFTPSQHGCPALARVVEGKIEILQQIFFETDSATIKDESFPVLQAVATTIKGLEGTRVRVEGHTDQQGTDEYNLDLSRRRARAVAQWLVQNGGVDAKLLETEGYGRSRPIVSGAKADLAQNRRVEFVILTR